MFNNLFLNLFGSKHQKRLYEYKLRKASQKPVEYPVPTEEETAIYNAILEVFKRYPPQDWIDSRSNDSDFRNLMKLKWELFLKKGQKSLDELMKL